MLPDLLLEGVGESVVVMAFDGLGYDLASDVFSPDRLVPLTTTFPSTFVTAWATALTGRRADEHGLLGVQFRRQG
jgi:predicted AlkP superfamily phosphohydrolase/phosphomutase